MRVCKPLLVLLSAGSTPLLLADEHHQHGAHEHGVGILDVAQQGAALHIELENPAVNIVGFEHAPKNKEDHETIERALARLRDGAGLFALTEAAVWSTPRRPARPSVFVPSGQSSSCWGPVRSAPRSETIRGLYPTHTESCQSK